MSDPIIGPLAPNYQWVSLRIDWFRSVTPAVSAAHDVDAAGRVYTFTGTTPTSAARKLERIWATREMVAAARAEQTTQSSSTTAGDPLAWLAVHRPDGAEIAAPQAKPIADPQAFTDLDDEGYRIPQPDTVANPGSQAQRPQQPDPRPLPAQQPPATPTRPTTNVAPVVPVQSQPIQEQPKSATDPVAPPDQAPVTDQLPERMDPETVRLHPILQQIYNPDGTRKPPPQPLPPEAQQAYDATPPQDKAVIDQTIVGQVVFNQPRTRHDPTPNNTNQTPPTAPTIPSPAELDLSRVAPILPDGVAPPQRGGLPVEWIDGNGTHGSLRIDEFGQRYWRYLQANGRLIEVTEGGGSDGADRPWTHTKITEPGQLTPHVDTYDTAGVTAYVGDPVNGIETRVVLFQGGDSGIEEHGGGSDGSDRAWTRTTQFTEHGDFVTSSYADGTTVRETPRPDGGIGIVTTRNGVIVSDLIKRPDGTLWDHNGHRLITIEGQLVPFDADGNVYVPDETSGKVNPPEAARGKDGRWYILPQTNRGDALRLTEIPVPPGAPGRRYFKTDDGRLVIVDNKGQHWATGAPDKPSVFARVLDMLSTLPYTPAGRTPGITALILERRAAAQAAAAEARVASKTLKASPNTTLATNTTAVRANADPTAISGKQVFQAVINAERSVPNARSPYPPTTKNAPRPASPDAHPPAPAVSTRGGQIPAFALRRIEHPVPFSNFAENGIVGAEIAVVKGLINAVATVEKMIPQPVAAMAGVPRSMVSNTPRADMLAARFAETLRKDSRGRVIPPGVNRLPNGKLPSNFEYAGKKYPVEKLPPDLRTKYPASVQFTHDGFPDFSPYAKNTVKFDRPQFDPPRFTGNRSSDFTNANRMAGYRQTPDGYTWHHHQDGKTMQLVPTDLHDAVRHAGGVAIAKGMR
ncbi:HNH endonuclease [Nocardia sp. NPDC004654]|uniref:HNH endonuclease n=1 Tax=Nocardia sp. NPDC004654 TaxID=3154776 RepID=UPI0033A87B4A